MWKDLSFKAICIEVSKDLLGKLLVRVLDDGETRMSGLIIEVETGREDKAAHSYLNKVTTKNKSMFLDGGHIYIYKSFRGKTECFNIYCH